MAITDDAWASLLGREPQQDEVVEVWALDFSRKRPVFTTKVRLWQGILGRWKFAFVKQDYSDDIFATKEEAQRVLVKGLLRPVLFPVQDDSRDVDAAVARLHKELERAYRKVIASRALLVEHGATKAQLTAFEKHVGRLREYERSVVSALLSGERELIALRNEALAHEKTGARRATTKAPKRSGRASKRA